MGGTVYEDTRQQAGKHKAKHRWFEAHGVDVVRRKLDFGDYMADGSNVSVDTKKDIYEVASNLTAQHDRFRRECERAAAEGCRLVVLVENRSGVSDLGSLSEWREDADHLSMRVRRSGNRYARRIDGATLSKAMSTMFERYGVRFEFCHPNDSARRICEELGVSYEP